MYLLEIALGLAGLIAGGELLVRGAVAAANRFGVSPLLIGLTLVGFGTSSPELVTSLEAALAGSPGIAIGNVVGSNIANILLILGLAAAVAPIAVAPKAFRRDGAVLALVSIAAVAVLLGGRIDWLTGLAAVAALAVYVVRTYVAERRHHTAAAAVYEAEAESLPAPRIRLSVALGLVTGGLVLTVFAARFLVSGSVTLATALDVPDTVIGLTIVAVGTSMPELVTSILAARRGNSDVALGNIVGSNIFNLLGILGVTAMVQPLAVPAAILALDAWVMLAATAVLLAVAVSGWQISRLEGSAMIAAYAAYTAWLIVQV